MLRRGTGLIFRSLATKPTPSILDMDDHTPVFEELMPSGRSKITLNNAHTFFIAPTPAGGGFFGKVYPVYTSDDAKEPVSCVKISVHQQTDASFEREASILSSLGHESFLFAMDERNAIYKEWHPGKSLTGFSEKEIASVPLEIRLECLYSGLMNLFHIHESGYAHRDLRADNIVLDIENRKIHIIDFGMSARYAYVADIEDDICDFMQHIRFLLFSDLLVKSGQDAHEFYSNPLTRFTFDYISNLASDYIEDPEEVLRRCKHLIDLTDMMKEPESNKNTRRLT